VKLEVDLAADGAYFEILSSHVEMAKELEPSIMADDDADGFLVGVEVLSVRKRIDDDV